MESSSFPLDCDQIDQEPVDQKLLVTMDALLPPGTDSCAIPASVVPEGETYNFKDPPTLTPAVITVGTIMSFLSIVFVYGRVYANRKSISLADCNEFPSEEKSLHGNKGLTDEQIS